MTYGQRQSFEDSEKEQVIPLFGYDLIREDLLPDLLGSEHQQILYWAGKSLARKYPVAEVELIEDFFRKAGFGELKLIKTKKSEMVFELISPRFYNKKKIFASLEAGFLAAQIQQQTGHIAETLETAKPGKSPKVVFEVKWDLADPY